MAKGIAQRLSALEKQVFKMDMRLQNLAEKRIIIKVKELDASLPAHLHKSLQALNQLQAAKAEDVAKLTGRARAAESSILNELARFGVITKENRRQGRFVLFKVKSGAK